MRRVATAVGITPMAIYHHFADRRALLNFVVDREFTKYSGILSGDSPARHLRVPDP